MLLETPRLGSSHEPLSEPLRTWRRHQAARAGGPPSRDRRLRGPARQGPAGGARAQHAHHGSARRRQDGPLERVRPPRPRLRLLHQLPRDPAGREDLSALIMALHRVNQKSMPVIVVAAGLPQLPRLAAEAQSYAERLFRFVRLGALPAEAAAEAIELPASRLGADYEPDALEAILDASGRYPYFLQEWGSKVWDIAPGPDFTLEDVQVAGVEVEAALDQGFFAVRAERATETERKLMRAMAWLGEGPYRWAQVVDASGGDLKTCSVLTDRLLKKGLVYRPRHAELDFTVPHFAPFIRRHYPTLRR